MPQQQPLSQMPLQAYANYAMGLPWVGFSFRVEPPSLCFSICLASAFCFQVPCWMPYSPMGAQLLDFASLQPFGAYPWKAYVQTGDGYWPTPDMHRVAALSTTLSKGSLLLLSQLSPSLSNYMVGHTALGLGRESPSPSSFLAWWGGVFFSRFGSNQ